MAALFALVFTLPPVLTYTRFHITVNVRAPVKNTLLLYVWVCIEGLKRDTWSRIGLSSRTHRLYLSQQIHLPCLRQAFVVASFGRHGSNTSAPGLLYSRSIFRKNTTWAQHKQHSFRETDFKNSLWKGDFGNDRDHNKVCWSLQTQSEHTEIGGVRRYTCRVRLYTLEMQRILCHVDKVNATSFRRSVVVSFFEDLKETLRFKLKWFFFSSYSISMPYPMEKRLYASG